MVVLILESVPASLRGELSRWMIEPHAGVFVGSLSGMVRDKLWDKVTHEVRAGNALMIHAAKNEQGFTIHAHGDPKRQVWDAEGLTLIRCPTSP